MKKIGSWMPLVACIVLMLGLIAPEAFGQRGFGRSGGFGRSSGSFGRSSSSFGRSGGFTSPRSSSGWFGRSNSGSSSFSRSSTRSFSGSGFGRSGSFGSSSRYRSTSVNRPPVSADVSPSYRTTLNYGGSRVPAFAYGMLGGYSLAVLTHPQYHWMPWHPSFYMNPPVYYNGAYYSGGFSFTRFIFGIVLIGFAVWLISKLFSKRKVRYTTYR